MTIEENSLWSEDLPIPKFSNDKIQHFHSINFQRLVQVVLDTEIKLNVARNKMETNHRSEKKSSPPKPKRKSPRSVKPFPDHTSVEVTTYVELSKNIEGMDAKKSFKHSSQNKVRNVLQKNVKAVAESLTNFQRAVHVSDNYGNHITSDGCKDGNGLMFFVDPIKWREELSMMTEEKDKYSDNDSLRHSLQAKDYNHTNASHVRSMINRSNDILQEWRENLQVSDKISASDFMDEYELGDEKIGWTKLFDAVVKQVIEGTIERPEKNGKISTGTARTIISLGDSSKKDKYRRDLLVGERAVLVHYIGYPKNQDSWFIVKSKDNLSDGILLPKQSQTFSLEALTKLKENPFVDDRVENRKSIKCDSKNKNHQQISEGLRSRRKSKSKSFKREENKSKISINVAKKVANNKISTDGKVNLPKNKIKFLPDLTIPGKCQINVRDANGLGRDKHKTLGRGENYNEIVKYTEPLLNSCLDNSKSKQPLNGKFVTDEKEDPNLSFTWICTECGEAECIAQPESPLIVCEGLCNRPFHIPCAGLARIPKSEDNWICNDCKQMRHQCAVCHEYGEDDRDVYKCSNKNCGLFFHIACLNMYDVDVNVIEQVETKPTNQTKNVQEDDYMKIHISSSKSNSQEERIGPSYTAPTISIDSTINHISKNATDPNQRVISRYKFKCPAHYCWTCSSSTTSNSFLDDKNVEHNYQAGHEKCLKTKKIKGKSIGKSSIESLSNAFKEKKGNLFRCLHCPISYHVTCIPPRSRFHELALLCHEHASGSKLPFLDMKNSYQAQIELDAERKLEALRDSTPHKRKRSERALTDKDPTASIDSIAKRKFLSDIKGFIPDHNQQRLLDLLVPLRKSPKKKPLQFPSNAFNFCLPCDFQKEVHSKPPVYTHIHSNRYNPENRPKRHPPSNDVCQCKPSNDDSSSPCDDRCFNRLLGIECVGDGEKKIVGKNSYWNCNHGLECGNRKLSRRQFAKCRPQREKGKGWGLIAINGIKSGDLVQEYAGEIIDEKEKRRRLESWAKEHPNDPNFYIMKLEQGWYIDARVKGNLSRFINHSCDPNCKLIPVNVAGYTRVAIIATKPIASGEYLSYDYQFDTKHGDKFICRCGAALCRGTMKGGSRNLNDESSEINNAKKKTKKQLFIEAKARLERDKKFLLQIQRNERSRLYQTGMLVPGECIGGSDTVASGPQLRNRSRSIHSRIFLWRNALIGADFSSRYARMCSAEKLKQIRNGKKTCTTTPLTHIDVLSAIRDIN